MPAPGDKVRRYTLVRELGRGGSGVVFEALDVALGRNVALKWMHVSLEGNDGLAERFLRGARSAARVVHPGTVNIYDIDVWEGHLFVVMDLLHGHTLDVELDARSHGIGEIITQLIPTMLAVHAAHGLGILHRDIKPNNLFAVMEDERWVETKVLDFGAAKWLELDEDLASANTEKGTLVGTPIYMPPEQLTEQPYDHRGDIYSFGLVFYQSIAGSLPFSTRGFASLVTSKLHTHPGLRNYAPEVPVELEAVIARALAVEPDDRYPNILAFVEALRPFAATEVTTIARASTSSSAQTLERTLMPVLSSTATAGLAVSIFGDPGDRVAALREKVRFYNDSMASEYQELTYLVRSAHMLWLACVGATFVMMIVVVFLVAMGQRETAIVAGVADVLAGLTSALFQRREDHYRALSERKRAHLEYGQEWAATLHSIDAIKQESRKEELLGKLIETQIKRLKEKSKALPPA